MSRPKTPISLIQTFASSAFVRDLNRNSHDRRCSVDEFLSGQGSRLTSSAIDKIPIRVFGLTSGQRRFRRPRASGISPCPERDQGLSALRLPLSVTIDLNFAIRVFLLTFGRRVVVPVHCTAIAEQAAVWAGSVVLWNIRSA